jgi:hypothetical protein
MKAKWKRWSHGGCGWTMNLAYGISVDVYRITPRRFKWRALGWCSSATVDLNEYEAKAQALLFVQVQCAKAMQVADNMLGSTQDPDNPTDIASFDCGDFYKG